jgi:hypothetical protein
MLLAWVCARAPAPASAWLTAQLAKLDRESFGAVFASAARRFGHAPVHLTELEKSLLTEQVEGGVWAVAAGPLTVSGCVRSLCLLKVVDTLAEAEAVPFVKHVFDTGDSLEREATLRCLWLLPQAERFVGLGIDACRSHVQSVFEAIACENPYPARYFPDAAFNQMVLKCFFTEVPLLRVWGLTGRKTSELARMALGYASERTAAGRSLPPDIGMVTDQDKGIAP